jgi:exosome complex component RRP45
MTVLNLASINLYCSYIHSTTQAMPREIEPPAIQREFTLAALAEGKRLDGRSLLELRDVQLEFGPELGWCTCSWGKTK